MFKKIYCLLISLVCAISLITPIRALDNSEEIGLSAQYAVAIDANSGLVLYNKNMDERMYPASMTKVMTAIVALDMIENLDKTTVITQSDIDTVWETGASSANFEVGETVTYRDLLLGAILPSGADATRALANNLCGSQEAFVEKMNECAKKLKLKDTHFVNTTGIHDDNHYTCALDLGTMAAYLIEMGGERLLQTTSLYDSYIREDTAHKFWLVNTNKLLKSYQGADGLKTGYTKEAGYCIVSTAKRNGLRLIAIVLKESDPKVRNQEVSQLLDYGFSLYENITLFQKNDVIEKVNIDNARVSQVEIIAKVDIQYVQDKNDTTKVTYQMNYTNLVPPLKKGEVVGHLLLMRGDVNIGSFDVTVKTDVEALSFVEKVVNQLKVLL